MTSGNIKTADGSAIVKQGNTTVVCGIKLELGKPAAETPDQGYIVPNVTLPPMCHPNLKPGPPSAEAQGLSSFIRDVIHASKCVNLTDLCPVPNKFAWVVYIDLVCLDHDGNLKDALVAALMAALRSLRLPVLEYDEDLETLTVTEGALSQYFECLYWVTL